MHEQQQLVDGRQRGHEVGLLKYEPDLLSPDIGQAGFLYRRNLRALDKNLAACRCQQATTDSEQAGLASSGRTEDRHEFARLQIERDVVERRNLLITVAEHQRHISYFNAHKFCSNVSSPTDPGRAR